MPIFSTRTYRLHALLGVMLLTASTISATPLAVVEGADFGDTLGTATAVGVLDIGLNTITGAIPNPTLDQDADVDFITVTTPAGLIISSLQIVIDDYGDFEDGSSDWSFAFGGAGSTSFNADGTYGLAGLSNPSTITFRIRGVDGLLDDDAFNYRIEIGVVTPEPANYAMVAAGILALCAAVRSRGALWDNLR